MIHKWYNIFECMCSRVTSGSGSLSQVAIILLMHVVIESSGLAMATSQKLKLL